MARTERHRGSIWKNTSKKKGYSQSRGSYGYTSKGDRHFKLTSLTTGKTRVYESPDAAEVDGWYIAVVGK